MAGEIEGLDMHEHGTWAYPEFVTHGKDGTPRSMEEAKKLAPSGMAMPSASAGD